MPLQEIDEASHVLADSESNERVTTHVFLAKRLGAVI
jgi:hypothetical protein